MNLQEWRKARRKKKAAQQQQQQTQTQALTDPSPVAEWQITETVVGGDEFLLIGSTATPGILLSISRESYMVFQGYLGNNRDYGMKLYRTLVALHKIFRGTRVMVFQPHMDHKGDILWKTSVMGYDLYVTGNQYFQLIADAARGGKHWVIESPIGWAKMITAIVRNDMKTLERTKKFK